MEGAEISELFRYDDGQKMSSNHTIQWRFKTDMESSEKRREKFKKRKVKQNGVVLILPFNGGSQLTWKVAKKGGKILEKNS